MTVYPTRPSLIQPSFPTRCFEKIISLRRPAVTDVISVGIAGRRELLTRTVITAAPLRVNENRTHTSLAKAQNGGGGWGWGCRSNISVEVQYPRVC